MDKAVILLPALNEVKSIKKVIDEVRAQGSWDIVIGDSGSTDGTVEVCKALGVQVLPGPKGKGANVANCIHFLRSRKDVAYVVMLDSDYTYPADYINPMLDILRINKYDVVIGARDTMQKNSMSITNLFGNSCLIILANLLYKAKISDLCTGYWAINRKAIDNINITAKKFELEANIFCECDRLKLRLCEIPILYRAREGSVPHLKAKDGFKIAWWLIKERVKRWK